jgi:drug/metabolite transporter (DMT)-like permease
MSTNQTDVFSEQTPLDASGETTRKKDQTTTIISLIALYILWGSTYLGMRIALQSFPPLLMAGIRFTIAGSIMFLVLCGRKAALPTRRQWMGAAIVGILLLVGGNAGVALAEQWVPSGLSAVAIGAVPLWVALLSGFLGRWPGRIEWLGLAMGFAGLVLLDLGNGFSANSLGTIILIIAPICWAAGSVCSKRLSLPGGAMSSAAQMLCAGLVLLVLGWGTGERIVQWPALSAIWAMLFLIFGGSLIAYTAYMYLLSHVRPSLATSYAYVNPLVAVGLGVWLAGERISLPGVLAMLIILSGVVLVTLDHGSPKQA